MVDADWLQELRELRRILNNELRGNSRWDSGDDWARRSQGACDNATMKAIIEDNRRGGDIHGRASVIPPTKATSQQEPPRSENGWVDPVPLKPQPGIDLIDSMCAQQDRIDAAQRARQLGLSHEEWARLTEKDLQDRRARKEKADKARKETPK